jgi:hypothetical protein
MIRSEIHEAFAQRRHSRIGDFYSRRESQAVPFFTVNDRLPESNVKYRIKHFQEKS